MVKTAETSDTKGLLVMLFAYLTYGTKRPGANLLFKAMQFPREIFSILLRDLKSQVRPGVMHQTISRRDAALFIIIHFCKVNIYFP